MTPAARHLLAALSDDITRQRGLRTLAESQWQDVADLAIRQRVGPLLLYRTRNLLLPDVVRERLQGRAHYAARRVLELQGALREIASAVRPLGITPIVLKGMHLATAVYDTATLREMNDVDILVPQPTVDNVKDALNALGYRPLSEVESSLATEAHHHLPRMMRGRVGVEIHWHISDPASSIRPSELIGRAVPLRPEDNTAALANEDLLIHLCLHAASNHTMEMGLRPLVDIQELVRVRATTIDWEVVSHRSHLWECQRSVALMLTLAKDLVQAEIPETALKSFSTASPDQVVLDQALSLALHDDAGLSETSIHASRMFSARGVKNKMTLFVNRIALSPARLASLYPGAHRSRLRRYMALARRTVAVLWRHSGWLILAGSRPKGDLRAAIDRRLAVADWLSGG